MRIEISRPLALLSLFTFLGCAPFLRTPREPLETIELSQGEPTPCLAILLPGRFGGPESFTKAKFEERVADQGIPLDLIAVDAHFGYYRERSLIDRLREDVIHPAQKRGYREIWLVGPSMGGLGTLLYTKERGADLTGAFALAPYVGKKNIVAEIEQEGGVRAWSDGEEAGEDVFRKLWLWLGSRFDGSEKVPLHLGWGTEDRLAPTANLIAELLPEEQVYTASGGHDWEVWSELWEQFLERSGICADHPS